MQLKIKRTQKTAGMMSHSVVFCLDARLQLTPEEAENMGKYKLGDMVVYSSEDAKKHLAAGMDALNRRTAMGVVKGWAHAAAFKLSLTVTLKKLVEGTHIECKDITELLGAEDAIEQAARTAKAYLETAATFDGREDVRDVA